LTSRLTSRNTVSTIPSTALNVRKVNESPAAFYTTPTAKKAKIIGSCSCTGLGAAAEVRLVAGGVNVLRFVAADVTAATTKFFDISLAAAETLAKDQDSGTNGELDLNCTVQESPA